ncbi:MAG TPA: MotA/TolQ/ExbB proton channel family protein [Cytophagaceae bacterium]|jgi:biopolymer transport protein ExbB|nr:MotA/TolQ/ExbB proton channel family protein [Cytophagaceae bacterium]
MFIQPLLQITTTTVASTGTGKAEKTLSVLELMIKGGWVMIPIGLLSLIAVYIIVERMLTLKKADKDPERFLENIKNLVYNGDISGAVQQCQQFDTPFSKMIEKGISKIGTPLPSIEASIENVGKVEVYKLEKNLNILATISGAGPMLGFFGTVLGLVQAFMAIAREDGSVSPKLLSTGMYEAMITTVGGLIVGIIAYVGYNYLVTKVDKIVHQMEYASIEFIELLQQPK